MKSDRAQTAHYPARHENTEKSGNALRADREPDTQASGLTEILQNTLSAVYELNQRLSVSADRLAGPMPAEGNKQATAEPTLLNIACALRVAVSDANSQLDRIERAL